MKKELNDLQDSIDRMDIAIRAQNDLIEKAKDTIKGFQKVRDDLFDEQIALSDSRDVYRNLSPSDPLFKIKDKTNKDWKNRCRLVKKDIKDNPEKHEEWLANLAEQHKEAVIEGFLEGWWDLDDNGNMAAPALTFSIADFSEVKNPLMAHVMKEAGIFPSVGQARKNGWEKPLIIGEWCVTKKKIRIKVTK